MTIHTEIKPEATVDTDRSIEVNAIEVVTEFSEEAAGKVNAEEFRVKGENMARNTTPKREYQSPKPSEINVDASTLTVLAVATLLLPLLMVGFFR